MNDFVRVMPTDYKRVLRIAGRGGVRPAAWQSRGGELNTSLEQI